MTDNQTTILLDTDGCLLFFLQEAGLRPNVHVFSALIGRATQRLDYIYLKMILKSMSDMEVWPNEVIIKQLEFAAQYPPNYNQVSAAIPHVFMTSIHICTVSECVCIYDSVFF